VANDIAKLSQLREPDPDELYLLGLLGGLSLPRQPKTPEEVRLFHALCELKVAFESHRDASNWLASQKQGAEDAKVKWKEARNTGVGSLIGGLVCIGLTAVFPPATGAVGVAITLKVGTSLMTGVSAFESLKQRSIRSKAIANVPLWQREVERLEHEKYRCEGVVRAAVADVRRARAELDQRHEEEEARNAQEAIVAELRRQAETNKSWYGPILRLAMAYWRNVGPDPEGWARRWWREILAGDERLVGPCLAADKLRYTADDCRRIAEWAVAGQATEVAYLLSSGNDVSVDIHPMAAVDSLTFKLRRVLGDYRERILPIALEQQRREQRRRERLIEREARLERDERLLVRERRVKALKDPGRPPTALERLANRLPTGEREAAISAASEAFKALDRQAFNFALLQEERKRLEGDGLPQGEIDDRMERLELDLNEGVLPVARKRGNSQMSSADEG
jgi:hypothetical protein